MAIIGDLYFTGIYTGDYIGYTELSEHKGRNLRSDRKPPETAGATG